MSLQKAGGTNIDNTVLPAAAANLVDHLETHLVTAGWTIISGGGSDAIKFESAAQADGFKIRIVTSVSGADMTLQMTNVGETANGTVAGIHLNVDGVSTWVLMANKFGFVLFEDTAIGATGEKWCMCGTMFLESFLTPTITEVGFLMGDHRSSTSNTLNNSFRTHSEPVGLPAVGNFLYNGVMINVDNVSSSLFEEGHPSFFLPQLQMVNKGTYNGTPTLLMQYASGEHLMSDAMLAWGEPSMTANFKKIRGQLFDVVISADPNLNRGDVVTIGVDTFRVVNDNFNNAFEIGCSILWLQP